MYDYLKRFNQSLALVLGPSPAGIQYDKKLWIGGALVLTVLSKWVFDSYKNDFHWRAIFVFGFNLITLVVVQDVAHEGILMVSGLCLVNAVVDMFLKTEINASQDRDQPPSRSSSRISLDQIEEEGYEASTVYESVDKPFLQVLTIFLGQMSAMFFLLSWTNAKLMAEEFDQTNMTYVFWLAAFFAVQMATIFNRGEEGSTGAGFQEPLWLALLREKGALIRPKASSKITSEARRQSFYSEPAPPIAISRGNLFCRACMAFLVNGLGREIIAYLVPILVMKSPNPAEYVMNALAINWITMLDDIKNGQEFIFESPVDYDFTYRQAQSGVARLSRIEHFPE
mmetsp:Transcript_128393/g.247487  ORF Transcript_128393/g.247487 Transcript_128393/m.247487 type:complete len:340 (+) Transcript_128393:107-1126(+)